MLSSILDMLSLRNLWHTQADIPVGNGIYEPESQDGDSVHRVVDAMGYSGLP